MRSPLPPEVDHMTKADDVIARIYELFDRHGRKAYGESPVNTLEHSLQVALHSFTNETVLIHACTPVYLCRILK